MKKLIIPILLAVPLFAQPVNVGHKIGHFTVGFGVAWGCGLANHHETGLAIGIGLGLAKEYADNKGGESWSSQKRDIIITSAGAFLGYAIAKHYYPEGADLERHDFASMSLTERDSWDRQEMAVAQNWKSENNPSLALDSVN